MSKIRIYALAKELGLDNKELIEHAAAAGVTIKNALASITTDDRDKILAHMKGGGGGAVKPAAAPTATVDPPAPRDLGGRVRSIDKPVAPRPEPQEPEEVVEDEPAAEAEVPEQVDPATAPPRPPAETARPMRSIGSGPPAKAAKAKPADPPAEPEAAAANDPAPADAAEKPAAASDDSADPVAPEPVAPKPKPTKRPPMTARPRTPMREMVAVGSMSTNAKRDKAPKRPQLARPNVAEPPKFETSKPVARSGEGKAQKPDMKLPSEVIKGNSPLSRHLKDMKDASEGKGRRRTGGGGRGSGGMVDGGLTPEQILQRRKSRGRRRRGDDDPGAGRVHRLQRRSKRGRKIEYSDEAVLEPPFTVRSLSEAMGRPANQIIGTLMRAGTMVRINDTLTEEQCEEIAVELGVELQIKKERSLEEEVLELLSDEYDEGAELWPRPPVVTILGHVDHGKTTMLDKLREANVAGGEAGGITQHIAAYQIEHGENPITFVDTPGHAAFGAMRARGANVTDIVVLVVAADDGVMPQTVEAISHAKAAEVPIIVALNKCDLPGIDEQKTLQQLAANELLPAEWGGDVEVVRTSGETGDGLDDLLETIQITNELAEPQVNPERAAVGTCLEAFMDEGRGVLAWMIVQKGTLEIGDVVLCGSSYGRVRAMYDDQDRALETAPPSTPIVISGLETVPEAGSRFVVFEDGDIDLAREIAEERARSGRSVELAQMVGKPKTLEDILDAAAGHVTKDLPLIIKADTPGSIEAIKTELAKFEHPEVRVKVIHSGVGGVNESDVSLAASGEVGAVIVAFHVIADDNAAALADREGVEIRRYSIIYEVLDDIRNSLEGMLAPDRKEVATGRALVLDTFKISRLGVIAGCRVLSGLIERNNRVHVIRDQTHLNTFDIASLRRIKDDVKEVREGYECGIRLQGFNDVKEGDLLEAFRVDEIKRTLEDAPRVRERPEAEEEDEEE